MKDFLTWEREFLNELAFTPTAKRARAEIVRAAIDDGCERLLYGYAEAAPRVLKETRKGIEKAANAVKTARRAKEVASARAGDRRAMLFRDRARAAILRAVETPWPFESEDAAEAYPDISALPLAKMPFLFADVKDAQRRFDRKIMLAVLRDYARKHGVTLGLKRLVVLAGCACPRRSEDFNNMARFMNRPAVKRSTPSYLKAFEAFLDSEAKKK